MKKMAIKKTAGAKAFGKLSKHFQEWLSEAYGHLVGVGSDGIALRLHGARIAAGYNYLNHAAKKLNLSPVAYIHAEIGLRPIDGDLMVAATELFDVDQNFLLSGAVHTDRDRLALRLAKVLKRWPFAQWFEDGYEEWLSDVDPFFEELRLRLEEMRLGAGYSHARQAAQALGLPEDRFWGDEVGMYSITPSAMLIYALTFKVRPEWALFGEGDVKEEQDIDWQLYADDRSIQGPGL